VERRVVIVAGFGFRSGAELHSLRAAFELARRGRPAVTHLATVEDKIPALAPLARLLGLPLIGATSDAIAAASTLTRSAASRAVRETGSVAEASALVAAGPGACLLTPRHISPDRVATCAIAQGTLT
jgi:cobalt-precorrin 5A hydrolase